MIVVNVSEKLQRLIKYDVISDFRCLSNNLFLILRLGNFLDLNVKTFPINSRFLIKAKCPDWLVQIIMINVE